PGGSAWGEARQHDSAGVAGARNRRSRTPRHSTARSRPAAQDDSESSPMTRRVAVVAVLMVATARVTNTQTASSASPPASTTWALRDWSRVEMWHFFEPPPGGGNNDYAFFANRLFGGVQHTARAVDLTAALQYVQFGGLPSNADGPGALGTRAVD